MLEKLEQFCTLLRQNGMRVSTSEVLDATRALAHVGLEDPGRVREALAATLVKRVGDRAPFAELFALFFLRGHELALALAGTPLEQALGELGLSDAEVDALFAELAHRATWLDVVARTALGVRVIDMAPLFGAAGARVRQMQVISPLQTGYYTFRALEALRLDDAQAEIEALLRGLPAHIEESVRAAIRRATLANLAAIRQATRRYVEQEIAKKQHAFREEMRQRILAQKSLFRLSVADIKLLRTEVRRLAQKLRTQASHRPKIRARGRLDVRRTLRRSLASGGVPLELLYRRRRVDKPRLCILCDISDSVRNVSRFMLELVYTLQELFERVRSFVFVSDLGETTELFRTYEIDRAVELAYAGAVIGVNANSNYGRALELFGERFLAAVTSRTTVIVIGDGRNNYFPAQAHRLAELRRRARRVWWLNPESPGAWGIGDSAMREYEPHCDRVVVAQDLESLRTVLDELVL